MHILRALKHSRHCHTPSLSSEPSAHRKLSEPWRTAHGLSSEHPRQLPTQDLALHRNFHFRRQFL